MKQNVKQREATGTVDCKKMIRSGIYGLMVADALGVPVEFKSRESLKKTPVHGMMGGGTHHQPAGTWSDDSSMTLCLMDSIAKTGGIHTNDIMTRFVEWMDHGAYTPHEEVFDCGHTVAQAIFRYKGGVTAALCGGNKPSNNGNGSLMRILPMTFALYPLYGKDLTESGRVMELIYKISGLTHRHPVAQACCGVYVNIAAALFSGKDKETAVYRSVPDCRLWYGRHERFDVIFESLQRVFDVEQLKAAHEDDIESGGYVVETLEAALWCLLNTDNYSDCVLKAVNLGGDTDTTGAVAGGLAGLAYGLEGIPREWMDVLPQRKMIDSACDAMAAYMEAAVHGNADVEEDGNDG